MLQTLQLTRSGMPNEIIPYKDAVSKVSIGKAVVREVYENTHIQSSAFTFTDILLPTSRNGMISMPIPSVIQMTVSTYEPKDYTTVVPFNRMNVYIRDQGICQYCGKKVGLAAFTLEHIIPQCRGGKTWWDNIVIACVRCNNKKNDKALKRYFRKLIRKPYIPRLDRAAPKHIAGKLIADIPVKTWVDYVYWHIILEP